MTFFSKCEGGNCPLKNTCLRYIEFKKVDPFEVFGGFLVVPTSGDCKSYIKVTQ
jgi:hypothetical protein